MTTLYITAIGYPAKSAAEGVFDEIELRSVNRVNLAKLTRLGNFRTFTYAIEVEEGKVVELRRTLAKKLTEEVTVLIDWSNPMRMYATKKLRI